MSTTRRNDAIFEALDGFQIELPSWGFANTGIRFGQCLQPGAERNMAAVSSYA